MTPSLFAAINQSNVGATSSRSAAIEANPSPGGRAKPQASIRRRPGYQTAMGLAQKAEVTHWKGEGVAEGAIGSGRRASMASDPRELQRIDLLQRLLGGLPASDPRRPTRGHRQGGRKGDTLWKSLYQTHSLRWQTCLELVEISNAYEPAASGQLSTQLSLTYEGLQGRNWPI